MVRPSEVSEGESEGGHQQVNFDIHQGLLTNMNLKKQKLGTKNCELYFWQLCKFPLRSTTGMPLCGNNLGVFGGKEFRIWWNDYSIASIS